MKKTTKVFSKKSGGRYCSGKCGDVSLGPLSCPEGYSPYLNCVSNPPTLKCVKDKSLSKTSRAKKKAIRKR